MTKQELIAIGQRLRQQRNRLNLTREQFAELADIGAGYYGQIEVGTSQMSIDTLIKVSKTSRLSMEYILFGEEDGTSDLCAIDAMLAHCSPRELRLAEKVLQLFLLRGDLPD
jgi:transcriptional regulator with XRE-family HTH domain